MDETSKREDDGGESQRETASENSASTESRFADAQIDFPVTFDLRIIYFLAKGATIVPDLERIYASLGVKCAMIQGIAAPGAKYGRMGSRLTFENREQMYATYAEIGKLPYVKMAI